MKLTPQQKKIQERMQPGVITVNGFLGNDSRPFSEIIEDDKKSLEKIGISQEKLAEKMRYFTELAFANYEEPLPIDDYFEVSYKTVRGKILCPFIHPGAFPKGIITLKNLRNNLLVFWSPLNIHLIDEHCFFEGKGSLNRLEPEILFKALF